MPANLPHKFEQLRTGPRKPFLIVGAGLSWGLVPLPAALLHERQAAAENELKCGAIAVSSTGASALYEWAEKALARITTEPAPKLKLAEALGLLSDTRWTAGVAIPLRGTTPRHRVLARLVREERWAGIWSLNWDTHLENALERIGYRRGGAGRRGQPWQTQYQAILIRDDFTWLGDNQFFCILKPHGCVKSLIDAKRHLAAGDAAQAKKISDRFLITSQELEHRGTTDTDEQFYAELRTALGRSPLVVLGWSISEPYLDAVINNTIMALIKRALVEELTIVDPIFNREGHTKTACYYDLTKDQVHAELETTPGGVGADQFFLWLQALYALDCMTVHASATAGPAILKASAELSQPIRDHLMIGFADDFLPAWTRLCWRANLVRCAGYQSHELRLEEPDFHVPWNLRTLPRPDLAAAAEILARIATPGWDFSEFPGAAWDKKRGRLVIPLPAWGDANDFAGLAPLVKQLEADFSFVKFLEILPLTDDASPVSNEKVDELKATLAGMIHEWRFSQPNNLGVVTELRS